MITIIDYGMGNLRSIENAFKRLGARVKITDKPKDIEKAREFIDNIFKYLKTFFNLKRKIK